MNVFSKSFLAVTGLALSLSACAPAFKGEGSKKPDLARAFGKAAAAERKKVEKLPRIKSIKMEDAVENENAFATKVELDQLNDVKDDKEKSIATAVNADGEVLAIPSIKGEENTYTLELKCVDNCAMIVGVLTAQKNSEAVAKTEEVGGDKEESKSEEKSENKEENKIATQSGTTGPEEMPKVVDDSTAVRTGVIVNTAGEILHEQTLDVTATLDENVKILEDIAKQAQALGVTANKK